MDWNVYVTVRDERGAVRKDLVGRSPQNELAPILEVAMRRADRENGGVQVSRELWVPPVPAR
jgi:hypothetical protein